VLAPLEIGDSLDAGSTEQGIELLGIVFAQGLDLPLHLHIVRFQIGYVGIYFGLEVNIYPIPPFIPKKAIAL
jgi:hypothetical protein